MPRSLPATPTVEALKKEAKRMLRVHGAKDASVCNTLRLLHRFAGRSDANILSTEVKLTEAQYALAMDYGFDSWVDLVRHVVRQRRRGRAGPPAVDEAEALVEAELLDQRERGLEVAPGLAGEADDEVRRQRESRPRRPQPADLLPVLERGVAALHEREDAVGAERHREAVGELADRAQEIGEWFMGELRKIPSSNIKDVRGKGLLIGVEMKVEAGTARPYCEELARRGILCKETHDQVVRFAPPLTVKKKDLVWALTQIGEVLSMNLAKAAH
jgi:hypothetical protein